MKIQIYSAKGIKKDSLDMPKHLLAKENLPLLAQAIRVYEDRQHAGTAKVKTRGEVSLTSAKMYRQKGTGNARHGDYGAPIFVGGGVAHGPRGVKRLLNLPQKMRRNAFKVALNIKAGEGKLILVDNINSLEKTKEAQNLLDLIIDKELANKVPNRITVVLSLKNKNAIKAFRNIAACDVCGFDNLSAYDVYFGGLILLDKEALDVKKEVKVEKVEKTVAVKVAAKKTKKVSEKPSKSVKKVRKIK